MNRRQLFKLGVGAALAPVAAKLIPECMTAQPVQKMDLPGSHYRQYLLHEGDIIQVGSGVSYNIKLVYSSVPDKTMRIRILD